MNNLYSNKLNFKHRFIGEESEVGGEKFELTSAKTWIIDPMDGTTNFMSSNPHICTILGFMVDKVSTFGKFCHIMRFSFS